jgi:hypothetical protein
MNKTTLGTGAAIFLALAAMAWWFLPGGIPAPASDPGQAASAFMADIRAGKIDQAWEGTGSEFKSFMGKEQFRQFVKNHTALKTQATAGATTPQGIFRECAFMCGSLKVLVIVGNADGQWKVEGIRAG